MEILKGFEVINLKQPKGESVMTVTSNSLKFNKATAVELNYAPYIISDKNEDQGKKIDRQREKWRNIKETKDLRRDVAALLKQKFVKNVVQDLTSAGIDWQREKWQSGLGSKFIHQGEKNAAKYADEVIVLSKGVQDYFKETYGRETHFIPNGVNRPQIREASLITDKFGLKKGSCQCHEPSCLIPICTKNSPSPCGNGEQKSYIIFSVYLTECT